MNLKLHRSSLLAIADDTQKAAAKTLDQVLKLGAERANGAVTATDFSGKTAPISEVIDECARRYHTLASNEIKLREVAKRLEG